MMASQTRLIARLPLPIVATLLVALPSGSVFAADKACGGHQLLSKPRPETSCREIVPQILVSPDKALHAVIYPSSVSLDTTPDTESRVVIRASAGSTVTSRDFSSPRGMNGYYVDHAKWSPDSQFLVFSTISSGGHSPWSFPLWVFSRKASRIAPLADMIGGKPSLSGDFTFAAPHSLTASTWRQEGAIDNKVPITVDLEQAFAKLPPE
jgi:hypothetical protein